MQSIQLIAAAAFQEAVAVLALYVGACSMHQMTCHWDAAVITAAVQQAVSFP